MDRGDLILVRAYPDKELERVVLEIHPTYVLVCRPEAYPDVEKQTGLSAAAMGFPIEDVIRIIARANEAA